jgi:hypothetical protein
MRQTLLVVSSKIMEDMRIEKVVTLPVVSTELRGDEIETPKRGRGSALSAAKHPCDPAIG